jgi:hypothetical protein
MSPSPPSPRTSTPVSYRSDCDALTVEQVQAELDRRLTVGQAAAELERRKEMPARARQANEYQNDLPGYCREILGEPGTPQQEEIQRALMVWPHRVLVESGHSVGKTHLAASAINWHHDNFDPGICLSTAPTKEHLTDNLWGEVRRQRMQAGLPDHFIGPAAPQMSTSATHYAKGKVAARPEGFQGTHPEHLLLTYDEATALGLEYFSGGTSMHNPDLGHYWLVICNPIDTTSAAYQESQACNPDGTARWKRFTLSALDHPNIKDELEGRPRRWPRAVNVSQIDDWVRKWCDPIPASEAEPGDIEWRPGSGNWHRPGPEGQARILGVWPDASTFGVWSAGLWRQVSTLPLYTPEEFQAEINRLLGAGLKFVIGCDTARFGDDWTSIHVRLGTLSYHHESHNGWGGPKIAARLFELSRDLAYLCTQARPPQAAPIPISTIKIQLDDDGTSWEVQTLLQQKRCQVIPLSGAGRAIRPDLYFNRRTELWFQCRERARAGLVSCAQLPQLQRETLRQQLMGQRYEFDGMGNKHCLEKDIIKEELGRSPDDADAFNLAYYETGVSSPQSVKVPDPGPMAPGRESAFEKRRP